MLVLLAGCAANALEGFPTAEISVGAQNLTVAVADTSGQRSQGLQGRDSLLAGIDGILFVYDRSVNADFHMRTVGLPLDVWWFDEIGQLLGSTQMSPCPDGECISYPSPGPIMWALETASGEYAFEARARLELPEESPG